MDDPWDQGWKATAWHTKRLTPRKRTPMHRDRIRFLPSSGWHQRSEGAQEIANALLEILKQMDKDAAEIERLRGLLKECSDDLAAEIEHRYDRVKDHPAMRPKYERDMEPVARARAALSAARE